MNDYYDEINKLVDTADDIYLEYLEPLPPCLTNIMNAAGLIREISTNDEVTELSRQILNQIDEIHFYMIFHDFVVEQSCVESMDEADLTAADVALLNSDRMSVCQNLYEFYKNNLHLDYHCDLPELIQAYVAMRQREREEPQL